MAAAYGGLKGAVKNTQVGRGVVVGGYQAKPKSSLKAASDKDDLASRGKGAVQVKAKRNSLKDKAKAKVKSKSSLDEKLAAVRAKLQSK